MYYDEGPLGVPSRPPAYGAVPYQPLPQQPAPPPTFGQAPARKRQGSYADYYNGITGGGGGGERAKLPWEAEQRRRYPRGLIGGRMGGIPTPRYGQATQPGQLPVIGYGGLQQQQPQKQWLNASGYQHTPGGGMNYLRDHLGNMPGDWDYQQPQPQQRVPYQLY